MHKLIESKRELFHSKKAFYAIHKAGVLSKFDVVFLYAVYSILWSLFEGIYFYKVSLYCLSIIK